MGISSSKGFYTDNTINAINGDFSSADIDFGFNSAGLFLACDAGILEYSINGTGLAGRLLAGEKRDMPFRVLSHIYLRAGSEGTTYRLEAY